MYRKLLEDQRKQQKLEEQSPHRASHNHSHAEHSVSGKKYESSHNEFKQHFNEIKQIVDSEHTGIQSHLNFHQVPASERKRSTVVQSAMGRHNATATAAFTGSMQSASATSPFPEKHNYQVSSSYQIAVEDGSSRQMPASHNSVAVLVPLKKDKLGISADTRSAKLEANMSMQQLSRIERTSKRQLNSISKLQQKLTKTKQIMTTNSRHRYNSNGNDYIANESQSNNKALTAKDQTLLLSRAPKKVQIQDKRLPRGSHINTSGALNYQSAQHPLDTSANRSILKQSFNVNISTISRQSNVGDTTGPLAMSSRINPHKQSQSTMKTPLKRKELHNEQAKMISKTPMPNKDRFNGRKTLSVFSKHQVQGVGVLKQQQQQQQVVGPEETSPNNNSDLPLYQSQTRFRPHTKQSGVSSVARIKQQKISKPSQKDSIQTRVEQDSTSSMSDNEKDSKDAESREVVEMEKLNLAEIQAGQQTIEPEILSTDQRASNHYQAMQIQSNQDLHDDSNILTHEQRQEVTDMIDKLDLQQAIRQKARAFFGKESSRKMNEQQSHRQRMNQKDSHTFRNLFNQTQTNTPLKQQELTLPAFLQGNETKLMSDDEDQELLENIYSERPIASQHEIKRNLNQIISQRNADLALERNQHIPGQTEQDTIQLTEPRIFDRNTMTLGTSVGGSIIPPDADQILINEQAFPYQSIDQRRNQTSFDQGSKVYQSQKTNTKKKDSLPSVKSKKLNRRSSNMSQQMSSTTEQEMKPLDLLQISNHYKKIKQDKLAQTMYNTRQGVQRSKQLQSFKRDYCPYILGQFRYGLNQKAPRSTDPNAPAILRFSQMACYRFAESNAPYMQLYEDQIMELRKTRRFLTKEIAKSPEGKMHADQFLADSPLLKKMGNQISVKLIDEAVNDQVSQNLSFKQIPGLKKICDLKQKSRQFGGSSQFASNQTDAQVSEASGSTVRRMRLMKSRQFEDLLKDQSFSTLNSGDQADLDQGIRQVVEKKGLLDINADFVSDATPKATNRMKKATFEMDQYCADTMFSDQQLKMGLSLYYKEQEFEQRRHFKRQQSQLMNYLRILFGGETESKEYVEMAKNLTKKLRRQNTDDSVANKRAFEIQRDQTANLNIDEENINTEIISLLAEEIMSKTDFFDILKGKQSQIQQIQESQKEKIEQKEASEPMVFLLHDKTKVFNRVQNNIKSQATSGINSPASPVQPVRSLNRIETSILEEHAQQKTNYLQQVVHKEVLPGDQGNSNGHLGTLEDLHKEMAKSSFIAECEKNLVVTIPILLKIKNKAIVLERYQLNNGLCHALSMSLRQFPDIATDFHFDTNNLSDDDFAVMLDGMSELNYISRLSYSHNSFGPKSFQALLPVICRKQVKLSLRVLHLKHVKITAKVTNELLHALNQNKNLLSSLSLVNVHLNQSNYKELCIFIKTSRHIKELDISWNGMRCHQMYEVIDAVADNRTLQDLNLSYNNMHDSMQEKYQMASATEQLKNKALKSKLEAKMKRAKTQAQKDAAEREAMNNSMQQIFKLCKFIKMNTNLQHLNLSGMGMTSQMMNEFGRALRRTKSMVALHLSQNNGDNAELRLALFERAHMKPFEIIFRPDFKQKDNFEYKDKSNEKKPRFALENSIRIGERDDEGKMNAQGKSKISEQLNLKKMLKNKRGTINRVQVENDASEMLVFTRQLGHKKEMPGSGQWRMISTANDSQERCWVCNLETYSLVFWSRDFGLKKQQELKNLGIDEMAYENQLYELEERNKELGIEVDFHADAGNPQLYDAGHKLVGFPQIYGQFNNWKPQRMFTIEEFCYIIDETKPDIIKNLKKGNFVNEMVNTVKDMNDQEKKLYNDHMKGLMSKYNRIKNWRKTLGSTLRYKKPFLANSEALAVGNDINIAKIDEELYPSDSESDFGSNSDSDSGQSGSEVDLEEYDKVDSDEEFEKFQDLMDNRRSSGQTGSDSTGRLTVSRMRHSSTINRRGKEIIQQMKEKMRMNRQLYVVPCFLQPGNQTFVINSLMNQTDMSQVQSKSKSIAQLASSQAFESRQSQHLNSTDEQDLSAQYFFHNVVVPQRIEKVPPFVKRLAIKGGDDKKFDRNLTCFKDWKPPTDKDLQKMLDHDKEHWKLPRFIKEERHYNEVCDVFLKNLRKLFYIFITLSAGSNFPGITWLFFTKFAENSKVIDKNIGSSDVDRFFLASAGDMAQIGCYRYQFFEAIMRVADTKYYKSGQAKSFAQALRMLIDNNCFPFGPIAEWQEFRDNIWWCNETHKVIEANKFGLQKIYKSYWAPRKKHMTKADCIDLMVRLCHIIPDENKVIQCYGMSKMHVISETTQKAVYDEMKYVEFLEFLGRCAYAKYKDFEDEPMERKLEMLMDEIFPTFSLVRKVVEDEEEELSESDPDY